MYLHVAVCKYMYVCCDITHMSSSTAHTPTCCIWVGTDKGNVIMMTVHVKLSSTEDQPRIVELTPSGNVLLYIVCIILHVCNCTVYVYTMCMDCLTNINVSGL